MVDLSDQDIIVFTEHSQLINISTASNGEATIDQTLALWEQKAETAYITDQNNKAALFYNLKDQQKKELLPRLTLLPLCESFLFRLEHLLDLVF